MRLNAGGCCEVGKGEEIEHFFVEKKRSVLRVSETNLRKEGEIYFGEIRRLKSGLGWRGTARE